MNNPQDLAQELAQLQLENIGNNACCCFVFMWCLGIEPSDIDAIRTINDALKGKVIEPDCTVLWNKFGSWLTGRNIKIDKVSINTIKGIKERTPVLYSINGRDGHWVGVENGKIKFNPKKYSRNVAEGKPISKRVIHIEGVTK